MATECWRGDMVKGGCGRGMEAGEEKGWGKQRRKTRPRFQKEGH